MTKTLRPLLRHRWSGLLGLALTILLTACGGGSGSGSGSGDPGPVTAVFTPASLSSKTIEGYEGAADFTVVVNLAGRSTFYLAVEERQDLVADGVGDLVGQTLRFSMRLRGDLAPGTYNSEVQVLACPDASCREPFPGSPMRLPLRYEVLPQIKVQTPTPMARTGAEPAPSQSLTVMAPTAAGTLTLTSLGDPSAISVELQGDRLVVKTRQVRAGIYKTVATLEGSGDSRFKVPVELLYVVNPPPGGEQPLAVTPNRIDLGQIQGTQTIHRFRIRRPTWTDALDSVRISSSDFDVVKNLRALGNDEYEFTVDTSNLSEGAPPGSGQSGYFSSILIDAGELGGTAGVSVSVAVNPPALLGAQDLSFRLGALATAADLHRASSVEVPDRAAIRWTASTDQAWLRLLRSAGTTGVDDLQLEVDSSVLDLPGLQQEAQLSVSVDRPGTLPIQRTVGVRNVIPRLDQASPAVLTSTRAKVYLQGVVQADSDALVSGVVSVTGARLLATSLEEDPRFVGFLGLLAVEVDGIEPGRAVTINTRSSLRPSSLTLPSVGAVRVAAGYSALPFGRYRPPSFAPASQALVFAGSGKVWRWPSGVNGWGALQQQPVSSLIDAALAPDESTVYATAAPGQVFALDGSTLAPLRQGQLPADSDKWFDPTVDGSRSALRFAADGRALASLRPPATSFIGGHGVGWLTGTWPMGGGLSWDISKQPGFADPGSDYLYDTSESPRGTAIAASADGNTVALSYPSGLARVYRGIRLQRQDIPSLPAGTTIVGLDNAGSWMVRDDGQLLPGGSSAAYNLHTFVQAGFVAAGYGISGGGEFLAVYSYRIASEPTGPRARDARVLLFDLRAALRGQIISTSPYAQLDLVDAVGCTGPLVAGETCEHQASVVVAQGGKSLFVLGPRGVAAVPLPDVVAASLVRKQPRLLIRRGSTIQ